MQFNKLPPNTGDSEYLLVNVNANKRDAEKQTYHKANRKRSNDPVCSHVLTQRSINNAKCIIVTHLVSRPTLLHGNFRYASSFFSPEGMLIESVIFACLDQKESNERLCDNWVS